MPTAVERPGSTSRFDTVLFCQVTVSIDNWAQFERSKTRWALKSTAKSPTQENRLMGVTFPVVGSTMHNTPFLAPATVKFSLEMSIHNADHPEARGVSDNLLLVELSTVSIKTLELWAVGRTSNKNAWRVGIKTKGVPTKRVWVLATFHLAKVRITRVSRLIVAMRATVGISSSRPKRA